jgi:SagB-type dehydrogenase family enzyme
MPPPTKRYDSVEVVDLPRPKANGSLTSTLLARRSWRRFEEGTISLSTFSSLLGYTAGVQQWVLIPGQGRVALKTSPSGGARHPIEVYVLAWGIEGLDKGLYHYASDLHALEVIKPGLDASRVSSYLPEGNYWSHSCALVLFAAAFERDIWRYRYSRAYRAPFIEAGLLCQTFLHPCH